MEAPLFRPRSVPEILDASFQVLRAEYGALVLTGALLLLPGALLSVLLPPLAQVIEIVQRLMYMVAAGATVVIVSDVYLGRRPDVRETIRRTLRRFWSLWGAALIGGILTGLGLLLLVIPGVIVWAWTFAMPVVVMLEGAPAADSFTRSKELAKGNVPRVLGAMCLGYLLFWIAAVALLMGGAIIESVLGSAAGSLASELALVLIYPFPSVVVTLLYYDLRIRKEGFDIQMLAESLGAGAEQPAPGSPVLG